MTIDFNKYKYSLDQCLHVFKSDRAIKDPIAVCTEISMGSMVPVLAVYAYAMQPQLFGKSEELVKGYEIIKKFYNYSHIIDFKA